MIDGAKECLDSMRLWRKVGRGRATQYSHPIGLLVVFFIWADIQNRTVSRGEIETTPDSMGYTSSTLLERAKHDD